MSALFLRLFPLRLRWVMLIFFSVFLLPGAHAQQDAAPAGTCTLSIITPRADAVLEHRDVAALFTLTCTQPPPEDLAFAVLLNNEPPRWLGAGQLESSSTPEGGWKLSGKIPLGRLSDGGHTLRVAATLGTAKPAVLPGAFRQVHFYVGRKDFKNYAGPSEPCLTVLAPAEGTIDQPADAKVWLVCHVALPANNTGGPFAIRYQLDGQPPMQVTATSAIALGKLSAGRHELTVDLVDGMNRPPQGVFNHVRRVFELRLSQAAQAIGPQEKWWQEGITPDLQQEPARAVPVATPVPPPVARPAPSEDEEELD